MKTIELSIEEYEEIRDVALITPWLIENMALICNNEKYTRRSLLQSSISSDSSGLISINTLLGMWDMGRWVDKDDDGMWFVFRIEGNDYFVFNTRGQVRRREGARKYMIQYVKYGHKIPYECKEVNVEQLKQLYYENTGLSR